MKKTALFTLFLLVLTLFVAVSGCTGNETPKEKIDYEMQIRLLGEKMEGTETVTFVNVYADELSVSVFHLYANAYREDAVNPAYASPLERYGGIELKSVTVDDQEGKYELSENGEYVTVYHDPVKSGKTVSVCFSYDLTIPSGKLRLSYNNGDYALSGFYPQLSVYQNGNFRTDSFSRTGDPYYSAASNYDVQVVAPKNVVAGGSTACEKLSEDEDTQTLRFRGEKLRDFAFAASADYEVLSEKADDVTVLYLYKEDENAQDTVATAIRALTAFSDAFGEYPYDTFTIARTLFEEEGMEFSGMTFVASDSRDLNGTIVHEIAHQWWYGLVGNDPVYESYMDEGLATFSAAYFHALIGEEDAFRAEIDKIKRAYASYERLQKMRRTGEVLAMDRPVYEYTPYQYAMVAYDKGCLMFASLYELYGKEKMNACLQAYCKNNAYGFGGKDAFVAAAEKTLGDVGGLMNGWIGEGAVATTFAVK